MYCSNSDDPEHCTNPDNWIREGLPIIDGKFKYFILGLEDLFYQGGVDIIFGAHEHSYERMLPVYKSKVCEVRLGFIASLILQSQRGRKRENSLQLLG